MSPELLELFLGAVMRCKESQHLLSAYLDRELGADQSAGLEAHLSGCPNCRCRLWETERASGMLSRLEPLEVPRELRGYIMTAVRRSSAGKLSFRARVLDGLLKLNPQLVSYAAGVFVSVFLFGATLAGFRPIRIIGPIADFQIIPSVFGSDGQYHIYNDLPPDRAVPSTEHEYELPRVNNRSSLISFSNIAYRKPGDEEAAALIEVTPDGRGSIVRVLQKPSDPDVMDDLRWSLSKRPFQPAIVSGRPVQTRIVLLVQKIDVSG
ncbi:MAG TPA: anti-sigma factor [Blastocatellia bacterium]|nr:anti-sigma factor [Blastocatellia bacterium]